MNKALHSGAGPRKLRWSLRCWLVLGAALAAPDAFAADVVDSGIASCQKGPRVTEPMHPALVSTERMLNAICARDVPTVPPLIDLEDPRVMGFPEGPRWVTNKGETIRRGWKDYMDNPVVLKNWSWVQGPDVKAEETMALVAAVVNYEFEVNGRPNPLKMRMTWAPIYAHDRSAARHVMVNGAMVVNDGQHRSFDSRKLCRDFSRWAEGAQTKAGLLEHYKSSSPFRYV